MERKRRRDSKQAMQGAIEQQIHSPARFDEELRAAALSQRVSETRFVLRPENIACPLFFPGKVWSYYIGK